MLEFVFENGTLRQGQTELTRVSPAAVIR
jgi:hypothetical protein